LIPQTGRRVCHLGNPNLYKSCVPCPCAYLRVLDLPIRILHRIINYLEYPLGRFAGLKHRHLARQVGVIITTGRIRRTLVNKIKLLVDSLRSIEASRLTPVKAESIFLRRASGRFGTSRGSSRGSSSTTSPMPHVWLPWHVAWLIMWLVAPLVVDYFDYAARPGASARRAACHAAHRAARRRLLPPRSGSSSTTSPTPRVLVPRHVARLVTRLVVDYFTYIARPVASARRAACRVTHRRLLRLAQARR
jgi:hypothetical protein